jgi:DNA-binding MarR family transcriptional regulator
MTHTIEQFEERMIGHHIGSTSNTLRNAFTLFLRENDINMTPEQFLVLKKLYCKDGVTQNEIALYFLRDDASITRVLDSLEKKKLVKRKKSSTDRRVNLVYIKSQGKDLIKKFFPLAEELNQHFLKDVSDKELKTVKNVLKKISFNAANLCNTIDALDSQTNGEEVNHKQNKTHAE